MDQNNMNRFFNSSFFAQTKDNKQGMYLPNQQQSMFGQTLEQVGKILFMQNSGNVSGGGMKSSLFGNSTQFQKLVDSQFQVESYPQTLISQVISYCHCLFFITFAVSRNLSLFSSCIGSFSIFLFYILIDQLSFPNLVFPFFKLINLRFSLFLIFYVISESFIREVRQIY